MLRDRQLELALEALQKLQLEGARINHWLYDMITYILCDAEEFDEVLKLMKYRIHDGELQISATLWFYLLDNASRTLHYPLTIYAWRKRVETGYLNPPSGVCLNILNTASRHGDFRFATDVFRVLGNRTHTPALHHYEALLESYLSASDLKTALTLLTLMTAGGVPPNEASTRPIYSYLKKSQSLPITALSILHELRNADREIPVAAVNVSIEASIYHLDLASAVETYKTLYTLCPSGPNTSTFNALFRGCSRFYRKDLAMFLASEMVALNVPPNALTYDRLIHVCLETWKDREEGFEDAWKYFREMRGTGWWPRHGTVVGLARRSCEREDERVWELVGERKGEGIKREEMEELVGEMWGGKGMDGDGEEVVRRESERWGDGEVV